MKESPLVFTEEQCLFVEESIPAICERGGWVYHIAACQPDHVHLPVSSHVSPKDIRRWFKTWRVQLLNEKYGKWRWFVRDGSGKWGNDEQYFRNAYEYIREQRTHLRPQVAAPLWKQATFFYIGDY